MAFSAATLKRAVADYEVWFKRNGISLCSPKHCEIESDMFEELASASDEFAFVPWSVKTEPLNLPAERS